MTRDVVNKMTAPDRNNLLEHSKQTKIQTNQTGIVMPAELCIHSQSVTGFQLDTLKWMTQQILAN